MSYTPNTEIPDTNGINGSTSAIVVAKNQLFAIWLEEVEKDLKEAGIKCQITYLPGKNTPYNTVPDSAWIMFPDGYRILVSPHLMEVVHDPVKWINGKLHDSPKNRERIDEDAT